MIEVTFTPRQLRSIEASIAKLGDSKSANILVAKAARNAAKIYLLPQSKQATPKRSGLLQKSTKIRAVKRKVNNIGVSVGYGDKDFAGDSFYGGFIEYGWRVGPRELGDARRHVKGQGNLRRVADANGEKATEYAAKLIMNAMIRRAKK